MQTFLPYPAFRASAAVLDDRRLGKQRVEALQVLRALHLDGYGWAAHPAVRMWQGHGRALVAYGLAVTAEWLARGHRDTTRALIAEFAAPAAAVDADHLEPGERPPWLGTEALHRSHRSALVRKDPDRYGPLFPGTPADLAYVWPLAPAPRPPRPARSAWVVRPATADQAAEFLDRGVAGVPAALASAGATRKDRRQLEAFLTDVRSGDRIAVVSGDGLTLGEVAGPAAPGPGGARAALAAVRPVRWAGTVPRAALLRPYQLQDPRALFTVHGEPAVEPRG